MRKYGPQVFGNVVQVALPAPAVPFVFGVPTLGNLTPVLKLERDDEEAESVNITLAIPDSIDNIFFQGNSELVAVVSWGQSRATTEGQVPGGAAVQATRRVEVDWINGAVLTVDGSSIQVWARWDNWVAVGATNVRNVRAFLTAQGSAHNKAPQRTIRHPNDLLPGAVNAFATFPLPGFSYQFQVVSNPGTALRAACRTATGNVLSSMDFISGMLSPIMRLPSSTYDVLLTNLGAANCHYELLFDLAL